MEGGAWLVMTNFDFNVVAMVSVAMVGPVAASMGHTMHPLVMGLAFSIMTRCSLPAAFIVVEAHLPFCVRGSCGRALM